MLLTERWARFLRRDAEATTRVAGRALWWPPTKIAGRELAGYLESARRGARPRRRGLPVNVQMRGGEAGEIEILSLLGRR